MRVTELQEMGLVGLRVVCDGDQYVKEIPKAANLLKSRLHEIQEVLSPVRLVGAFIAGDYSEAEDGYWVCVEVKDVVEVPEGMVSIMIPAQRYAVIRHSGPNHEIRQTYETLHKWMRENEYERKLRAWHLEITEEWEVLDASNVEVDLYDTIQ